jgi:O-6-methylguanine DNA methyltransferase
MLRAIACSGRIDVHRYAKVKTKIGQFWVGCSPAGPALISAAQNPNAAFEAAYQKLLGVKPRQGSIPKSAVRAIQDAVAGRPFNPVSIDLSSLSGFQSEVLKKLAKIPRGEVRPYSWLAREAGRPKAARAVGNIMARNPIPFLIPCHRVVPASGGIGNYGLGSALKRELLLREGVPVDEIESLQRKGVRYIGNRTTKIFCFPACPKMRSLKPTSRVYFANTSEAYQAGFRSCRRCRPA